MDTPSTAKAVAGTLASATLAAERERSPVLAAAYDATTGANAALQAANTALQAANTALAEEKANLLAKAKALTDALAENEATIAGCATEIAALTALYPAEETT
jgi:hypothetical protein